MLVHIGRIEELENGQYVPIDTAYIEGDVRNGRFVPNYIMAINVSLEYPPTILSNNTGVPWDFGPMDLVCCDTLGLRKRYAAFQDLENVVGRCLTMDKYRGYHIATFQFAGLDIGV